MSTWGGIGEGLTAGMNNRIELEMRRRKEAREQANADREFQFRQDQAAQAQANADRSYEANRADAAQAQANADRDFGLRSRSADLDASLKQQDMELRGALGELDAQMKGEELEGKKEDRKYNREKMANDLEMQRERLAGEKDERALRSELGHAELEGKKEDRKLRSEESKARIAESVENRKLAVRKQDFYEKTHAAEVEYKKTRDAIEDAYRNKQMTNEERKIALAEANAKHTQSIEDARLELDKSRVNSDQQFRTEEAKRNQGNAEADRELRSRGLDIQEANADRDNEFRNRKLAQDASFRELEGDREYQLKRESQDWASKKAEEEWRTLQTAREELESANRERQTIRESRQKSMARQLSLAFQQLEDGGGMETDLLMEGGNMCRARVIDSQDMAKIFGADASNNFAAIYAVDTPDNGVVFRILKNDGTFMMSGGKPYFDEDSRFKIYERGFGTENANRILREAGDKRDLGMFAEKENIKATAQERARSANDPYGNKRKIDAAVAILKADDSSEGDRASALEYLGSVFSNGNKNPNPTPSHDNIDPKMKALAEKRGLVFNEKTGKWEKKSGSSNPYAAAVAGSRR